LRKLLTNSPPAPGPASQVHEGRAAALAPPQIMLELQTRSGRRVGFPYAYLVEVSLEYPADDEVYLQLIFTARRVRIRGRNLAPIFEGLLRQSVKVLEESATAFDDPSEMATHISVIELEELT